MMGLAWAVVALAAAASSKEATFWMSWPDAYARGGGVGNQIEQLLGRVQCAMREGRPHHRLMVLPDLRSDRAKPPRRYRFEDVFDYLAKYKVPTELAHASIRHRPAKPPPYQLNGRDGPPVLTLSRTGTLHLNPPLHPHPHPHPNPHPNPNPNPNPTTPL